MILPLLVACLACGQPTREIARVRDDLPLPAASPQALLRPPSEIPGGVQEVAVEIQNGRFARRIYNVQPGPVWMLIAAGGGPYTFSIESLVQPRTIPENSTVRVEFTAPRPGTYTIRIDGPSSDLAILDVRPIVPG